MSYVDILRTIPTIQSATLAGQGLKFAKKKKKRVNDFLSYGTTAIVGTSLIQAEAKLIG